jgi:4-azaleucine resistance transporter AzlC
MHKKVEATRRGEFWAGFRDTIPLDIGAIPFGIIIGAVAVSSGISPVGAQAMSLFVFAGSAQFMAIGLVAGGVSTLLIVITTFVVNLRHALYSATLAPYTKHLPQRWLFPLAFWLTDETFVIVAARYNEPDESPYKHWYFLGSEIFMYVNWNICTLLGILAGQNLTWLGDLGLDFAMVVTFTGMLVPLMNSRPVLLSVVVAGLTAVVTYPLPHNLYLMVSALAGITAGVLADSLYPQARARPFSELESAGGVHE